MSCAARVRSAGAGLPTIGTLGEGLGHCGIETAFSHARTAALIVGKWVSDDDALAISPLNAESIAEKREPADGRRNLADRLLSLASVEFQDPAVRSVGTAANVARASLHPTP